MLAQLIQDLFHLERGEDGLDQHGGLDGALRQADFVLRHHEDVVPQARFQMAFHLGQVEERAGAAGDLLAGIVEQEQREIEDAARDALAVDGDVLFVQVPAARTHLQRGDLVVQLVLLALRFQGQRAAHGGLQVDLALQLVVPVGGVGVLEVGHVAVSARVEGVDHHLGFDRAGDFHAAAFQRLGHRGNLPVAFADALGFRQEIGDFAGVQALGALDARGQQFLTARLEGAVQLVYQGQGFRREDIFVGRQDFAGNLHARGQRDSHQCSPVNDSDSLVIRTPCYAATPWARTNSSRSFMSCPVPEGATSSRSAGWPARLIQKVV
ncbi:hypothetical protein D3C81_868900 [compost metagenome]